MPVVKTFGDLHRLNLKVKRDDSVQVTKAGSYYRARFEGQHNSVFGATAEDAKQRLLSECARKRQITGAPITKMDKLLRKGLSK